MTSGSKRYAQAYAESMNELPLDGGGPDISATAHDAAQGACRLPDEHGERLAAIVRVGFAAALEGMTPGEARGVLEDLADVAAARQALGEPGKDIPAGLVWTGLGLR
jgi:hypothetical protein